VKSAATKKRTWLKSVLTYLCGLFFGVAGTLHFLKPDPFLEIVPSFIPFPEAAVYVSGCFEIAGGLGMLLPRWRRWASYGLVALLVAVFPANINMAVNSIDFGLPHSLLWWRLPFQVLFIAWVYWCGKD
jgi:uncharacterized membrane protein